MIRTFTALFFLVFSLQLNAQKVQPEALSSGGDSYATAELKLDGTLGEFMGETIGNAPELTQGFHQGNLHVTTYVSKVVPAGTVKVFPNPTSDRVKVRFDLQKPITLDLIDVTGTVLLQRTMTLEDEIDVSRLTAGTYLLRLSDDGSILSVSTIQVIH